MHLGQSQGFEGQGKACYWVRVRASKGRPRLVSPSRAASTIRSLVSWTPRWEFHDGKSVAMCVDHAHDGKSVAFSTAVLIPTPPLLAPPSLHITPHLCPQHDPSRSSVPPHLTIPQHDPSHHTSSPHTSIPQHDPSWRSPADLRRATLQNAQVEVVWVIPPGTCASCGSLDAAATACDIGHIISYHSISYHIISYHIGLVHCHALCWVAMQNVSAECAFLFFRSLKLNVC